VHYVEHEKLEKLDQADHPCSTESSIAFAFLQQEDRRKQQLPATAAVSFSSPQKPRTDPILLRPLGH
jgi:hypothetical protein